MLVRVSRGSAHFVPFRAFCSRAAARCVDAVGLHPNGCGARARRLRDGRLVDREDMSENSFGARAELQVGDRTYEIYRLDALQEKFDVARLPFSLKVLLENL